MKQVQVPPFELILCQDVATASRNPLECLLASKTTKRINKNALRCSAAAQFTPGDEKSGEAMPMGVMDI